MSETNRKTKPKTKTKSGDDDDEYSRRRGPKSHRCIYSLSEVCVMNPCQNGGICSKRGRSFVCRCSKGFKGRHCEISECFVLTKELLQNRRTERCCALTNTAMFVSRKTSKLKYDNPLITMISKFILLTTWKDFFVGWS